MKAATALGSLAASGVLSELDLHFAGLLERGGEGRPEVLLGAALASRATAHGHVCLRLDAAAGELRGLGREAPDPAAWAGVLRTSDWVGEPGQFRPLVLDGAGRLYLHRYWSYERELADGLLARAARATEEGDPGWMREGLCRLFPRPAGLPEGEPDGQKLAAAAALLKPLCVVSGGPGTGKTTTVVKILALLLERAGDAGLRIALAAPTGKAAARLQEAVRAAKGSPPERGGLACSDAVRDAIPEEASTVHRLLGVRPGAAAARHGGSRPLPHDVVVVDEVSMLDLALTARLVRAVRPEARLILLGDRDQLASVEAGAVLGDLCDTGREHGYSRAFAARLSEATGAPVAPGPEEGGAGLRDCLALLRWSFRFCSAGGIGSASRAVNEGRAEDALAVMGGDDPQVARRDVPHPDRLGAGLEARVVGAFRAWAGAPDAAGALAGFGRSRILCAHRDGPFGSANVNRVVEAALSRLGLVESDREWYPGRPVMVTRNDHALRLYNGDVGIARPDPDAGGALRVFFPGPDGRARAVAPLRIPACETVYAMTVHKSQGSEFDDVLLILGDRPTRVLTRELLYTGLTRARERVEVWAAEEAFRAAVERRAERTSGLRDALWG